MPSPPLRDALRELPYERRWRFPSVTRGGGAHVSRGLAELHKLVVRHGTRSMFDRYDIIDERDTELAGQKMARFEEGEKTARLARLEVRAVDAKTDGGSRKCVQGLAFL
jgi:hypothetical protein